MAFALGEPRIGRKEQLVLGVKGGVYVAVADNGDDPGHVHDGKPTWTRSPELLRREAAGASW